MKEIDYKFPSRISRFNKNKRKQTYIEIKRKQGLHIETVTILSVIYQKKKESGELFIQKTENGSTEVYSLDDEKFNG